MRAQTKSQAEENQEIPDLYYGRMCDVLARSEHILLRYDTLALAKPKS